MPVTYRSKKKTATADGQSGGTVRPPPATQRNAGAITVVLLALAAVAWLGWQGGWSASQGNQPFVLAPLDAPLVTESSLFNASYREDMLWGTYRSGLYCGIRTREPKGLVAGLMWGDPSAHGTQHPRHKAQQGDGLATYGWTQHDLRTFGRQEIVDHGLHIETTFLKTRGGGYGGDWSLRVNVTAHGPDSQKANEGRRQTLTFYISDEGASHSSPLTPPASAIEMQRLAGASGDVFARGHSSTVGHWQLRAAAAFQGAPRQVRVVAAHLAHRDAHSLESAILQQVIQRYQRLDPRPAAADFDFLMGPVTEAGPATSVLQVQARVPFSVDYVFTSGLPAAPDSSDRFVELSGAALTSRFAAASDAFQHRFGLLAGGAQAGSAQAAGNATRYRVAQVALSNTLGSMGYFYGPSLVQLPPGSKLPKSTGGKANTRSSSSSSSSSSSGGSDAGSAATGSLVESQARPLFTAVPSRSFFPRGFLWDEGFHQLLVQQWDLRASCDAIGHWLDIMNADGWIPREQILGAEARERVPAEFLAQLPAAANPPTLFLPLMELAAAVAAPPGQHVALLAQSAAQGDPVSRSDLEDFLRRAWPRLSAWWHWFDRLQEGPETGSYRWRGRVAQSSRELNPKTLASGLDDFPRASHPSEEERHLDLLSWMAFSSQAMATIGAALRVDTKQVDAFKARAATLGALRNLRKHHWSERDGAFLDWGLHTEAVQLVSKRVPGRTAPDGRPLEEVVRVVTGVPPSLQHVPHFGYNSLFPVALTLLPADSRELGALLKALRREDLLWSPFGLRSLSRSSSLYGARNTQDDPPYWRGAVWINMNFLMVRSLRHYAEVEGPHQKAARALYEDLLSSVVGNVVSQYDRSDRAFLWENYNDGTGAGAGSHPFTGWTALVALLALQRF